MSFGGGDSPTGTQYQTQYTRDAPQVEAAKLGLMQTAKEYTQFGMNPWEAVTPGAKPGEEGYGQYKYTGTTGPYVGKEWSDLTREQRSLEGQAVVRKEFQHNRLQDLIHYNNKVFKRRKLELAHTNHT